MQRVTPNAVALKVRPFDDTHLEGDETIELTVVPGIDYTHSLQSKAQVTLLDNRRAKR